MQRRGFSIQTLLIIIISVLLVHLSIDDIRFQHVSLIELILFVLCTLLYFLLSKETASLFSVISMLVFISVLSIFVLHSQIGIGDIFVIVGTYLIMPQFFFLIMSISFFLCYMSLAVQEKYKTGFIPYICISLFCVKCGAFLC